MAFIAELSQETENKAQNSNVEAPKKDENNEKINDAKGDGIQWGYDLYPERRGPRSTPSFANLIKGKGREQIDKIRCERSVYKCIKTSPLVRLMLSALKSSGCAVDIRRHIACEECSTAVSGGYDPVLNQIIVCHNTASEEAMIQGVLTHEMIHMFDYCRNKLDFKNIDHLACTEIRAANLTHCSFVSAWIQGDASPLKIKESHQDCVKTKALQSVLAVRNVSRDEAIDAVERVFDRCYADLEPIGRRIRRNSDDMQKAYQEGVYYGYSD